MKQIQQEIVSTGKKRDVSIDILRAVALLCIIVAHCQPHKLTIELRSFDVPLMVFLSGVSFSMSSANRKQGYIMYLRKRFERLIIPTWIFLSIYYGLIMVSNVITNTPIFQYPFVDVIKNYTLQTGWYVWIMRVFFFIAILSPLIASVYNKMNHSLAIFMSILGVISLELIGKISENEFYQYFCITYPYVFIFGLGVEIKNCSRRMQLLTSLFFLTTFILSSNFFVPCNSDFFCPNEFKYPPRLPYFAYGMTIIYFLWCYRGYITEFCSKLKIVNFIQYIGTHSIWIYFWHILFLGFYGPFNSIKFLSDGGGKFLTITILSIAAAFLQERIILYFCFRCKLNNKVSNLLNTFFIG